MSHLQAVLFYPSGCDERLLECVRTLLGQRHYVIRDWQQAFTAAQLKPIMNQVWDSVRNADLIIAVLNNPNLPVNANVLYEFGFSQGHCDLRKACRVLTILCGVAGAKDGLPELPFDIQHMLHLVWTPADVAEFTARFLKEVQDRPIEILRRHERTVQEAHAASPWLPSPWAQTHLGILDEAKAAVQDGSDPGDTVVAATAALAGFVQELGNAERESPELLAKAAAGPAADPEGERALRSSLAVEAHRGVMEPDRRPSKTEEWHALQKHTMDRTRYLKELGGRLTHLREVRRDERLAGRQLLTGAGFGALWALAFAVLLSLLVAHLKMDCVHKVPGEKCPSGKNPTLGSAGLDLIEGLPDELLNAVQMLAAVIVIVLAGVLWRRNAPNSRLWAVLVLLVGVVGLYVKLGSENRGAGEWIQVARLLALAILGCWLISRVPAPSQLNDRRAAWLALSWGARAAIGTAIVSGGILWYQSVQPTWQANLDILKIAKEHGLEESVKEHLAEARIPMLVVLTLKHACIAGLVVQGSVRRLFRPWLGA